MRAPPEIPDLVREAQRTVSDPGASAWVAANAGSGKTYVLAQRVINLLLEGVEPGKILCITFTKAAAANMAKQVFDRLAAWVTLDDGALDDAIHKQTGKPSDARRRARARRLFAAALETPGGLKVQTIHAFCTQLLHQFPFEANVAARFEVLDGAEAAQLLEELTLAVLLDGASEPGSPIGRALAVAMTAAADQTFRDVVRDAIGQRDTIRRWIDKAGGVAEAVAALSRALGVEPSESKDSIEQEFFAGSSIPPDEWTALAAMLGQGGKSDIVQAGRFRALASLSRSDQVETYLDIFCTGERTPRNSLVTKAIKDKYPELVERLAAEQERVCALHARRLAVNCRDRSAALFVVANEVLSRYEDDKRRRGRVDYDDLIDKTLDLLRNVEASWVHYKLDLGINHLLIDEAQDTSAKQWEIVQRLVAEFTVGAGAREVKRTIFAVGDEKQSIFSFQNAAPEEFARNGRYFAKAHENSGISFVFGRLEHSFRSGESILAAVDEVFKAIAPSVVSDTAGFPPHLALPGALPGMVEIWQPTEPDPRKEIVGWDAPFDTISETSPRVKLAQRIARTVRKLIDSGATVDNPRRPTRPGDVLILVRQRGPLFEGIIRALKDAHIDVAGADRLVLTEHIAVMDLMVLADALLLPADDLALATVLRSPLIGFSDEELFDIAWNRGGLSLREVLARKDGNKFAAAAALLDRLARNARHDTPFAFYAQLLGAGGARRHFLARLGPEANDALDEFLNLALDYERSQTPSLQGFVAWLREAKAEIKRDMEIARDEVRVMTVHGAKGLEAPVVILADTINDPVGSKSPRLLRLGDSSGSMVWTGPKADDVEAVQVARQNAAREAENEYRRLLYVGMTRAADRLIVCGAERRTKRPDGCWYDLVRNALAEFLVREDDDSEEVFRYRKGPPDMAPAESAKALTAKVDRPALPFWLREPVAAEKPRLAPLSPSSAFDDEIDGIAGAGGSAADRQKALKKGRLVHRLMQSLPDIPAERRHAAAAHFLAGAKEFSSDEQAAIGRQVLAILDGKDFAELFAPGSRAEVPIVGRIPREATDPVLVSGQIDRLAVTANEVLIADYKTDRVPPNALGEVAPYVAQLALYRAVLSRLYPAKSVRAALLFTEGPRLMEVPVAAMDTALGNILAKKPAEAV